jgi:phosphoribosyl-ATP pyrophosphohydrolase
MEEISAAIQRKEQKFGENMPPGTRKLVEDGKAEIHRRIAERAAEVMRKDDDGA